MSVALRAQSSTSMTVDENKLKTLLSEVRRLYEEGQAQAAFEKADALESQYGTCRGDAALDLSELNLLQASMSLEKDDVAYAKEKLEKGARIRAEILGVYHESLFEYYHTLAKIGDWYHDYAGALEWNEKSIALLEKADFEQKHLLLAECWTIRGNCLSQSGRVAEALVALQKPAELIRPSGPAEVAALAKALCHQGVCHLMNNDLGKAARVYEETIQMASQRVSQEGYGDLKHWLAFAYFGLGNICIEKENVSLAKDRYAQSLELVEEMYDKNSVHSIGNYENLAFCYEMLGDAYKSQDYQHKAISLAVQNFGPQYPPLSNFYFGLGNVQYKTGKYAGALRSYLQALAIRQAVNEETLTPAGTLMKCVADTYLRIGKTDSAAYYCDQAIAQMTASNLDFFKIHLGESYVVSGNIAEKAKKYEAARAAFLKAYDIFQKHCPEKKHFGQSVLRELGELCYLQNQYDPAESYFSQALQTGGYAGGDHANSLVYFDENLKALSWLAKCRIARYEEQGNDQAPLRQAKQYLQQGVRLLDMYRTRLSASSAAIFNDQHAAALFEPLLYVNYRLKDPASEAESFAAIEGFSAYLLLRSLHQSAALQFADIPAALLEEEATLRADITWHEKKIQELQSKTEGQNQSAALQYQSALFDLNRKYETLQNRFEKEYPQYFNLKYAARPATFDTVQRRLVAGGQTMLRYFVGDRNIYIFVVTPDQTKIMEIKKDFPLEKWVEQIREGVYGYYTEDKALQTDELYDQTLKQYTEASYALWQKIIAPVKDDLGHSVIVVPDGALCMIPFETLLSGQPGTVGHFNTYPFLGRKHAVSYAYSARLLFDMQDKRHSKTPGKSLLTFVPYFNGDTTMLKNLYGDITRKKLLPLPHSGEEARRIRHLFGGDLFYDKAATEEHFTNIASDYRIIHLSTHGLADSRAGDYSFLAFTEVKDSVENELLFAREIYNLELNADLVTLSACETGLGELQRSEGLISLARAFAYAGAKSIVNTLWSVSDERSVVLMTGFYNQLKKGLSKDEALFNAKMEYLKNASNEGAHPFFWAGYILIGDASRLD